MSPRAIIFMAVSWTGVLGLVGWAYYRLLTDEKHHDPDGIGPAVPPQKARTEK